MKCSSPMPRRNFELSPAGVTSSQAPIPDKDVYWQLDTPESRRTRERMAADMENISDENKKNPTAALNRLRLFPSKRNSRSSPGQAGSEVLQDLLKLNAEMNNPEENPPQPIKGESDQAPNSTESNTLREENVNNTSNDLFEDEVGDVFADSDPFGMETETFQTEFDEGDDDYLLAASQALDDEYKSSTPVLPVKTKTQQNFKVAEDVPKSSAEISKIKIQNPQVSFCKEFEDDDGFDDIVSQMMDKESSPVLKPPVELRPTNAIPNPAVANIKAFDDNVNDSFDDLLSQFEMPMEEEKPLPVVQQQPAEVKPFAQTSKYRHVPQASTSDNKVIRKHSSFGSPASEKKIFGKKFQSDSQIEKFQKSDKSKCSKEEIERKRREALQRRSSSQKQRL